MTFKYMFFIVPLFLAHLVHAKTPRQAVVELGESQVQGTKPEHEEIIIVSRAPVDVNVQTIKFNGKEKIREEVKTSRLFDISYGD